MTRVGQDVDPRDKVGCACFRGGAKVCIEARYRRDFYDVYKEFNDDECDCSCHDYCECCREELRDCQCNGGPF